MPRKRKIEATTYVRPEAQDPAAAATTAPEGAPKRKRGRKAKETVQATCAAPGCEETFLGVVTDGGVVNAATDSPLCVSCDGAPDAGPAPDAPEAPTTPAPATRRKAPRKRKAKPAADTGGDGGLTMAALAGRYLKHLEDVGKSLGTRHSYSIDAAMAVRHFGPETPMTTLTPESVAAYFASDAVRKTRTGRPKARLTSDKSMRVLRLMLTWAAVSGLIREAPLPPKGD